MEDNCEALFAYGTLQLPAVQQAQFGRFLSGQSDVLPGYLMGEVKIGDDEVVHISGATHHPAIFPGGGDEDRVEGMVYYLSPQELASADEYEVDEYVRQRVTLLSGIKAWVYVGVAEN
jgi:gamma-glutamylcyclotransferase (GGCT)/AIG2-like uncharacterized protein YtfP